MVKNEMQLFIPKIYLKDTIKIFSSFNKTFFNQRACIYIYMCMYIYIYIYIHTLSQEECARIRESVLKLKYTDITQNTYIQS